MPESRVFLLNDPVPHEKLPPGDVPLFRQNLEHAFQDDFSAYYPGAPFLIYPVRTIRRKNILEMGLLCAASARPLNLIVTLPGTSETERGYSEVVSEAFARGLVPGLWGIGSRFDEAGVTFTQLLSTADIICSSSVQEGFGYLFVNAIAWGVPLLARYLDVLDGIAGIFDDHPHHFYSSIRVPVAAGATGNLRAMYEEKAEKLKAIAGERIVDSIRHQFEKVADEDTVDFSYLPVIDQFAALKKVHDDSGYTEAVRELNDDLFTKVDTLASADKADVHIDPWPFSLQSYAETTRAIIDSFGSGGATGTPTDVQGALIRRFAGIEYLRLLYAN
jgi:hypothetical protein